MKTVSLIVCIVSGVVGVRILVAADTFDEKAAQLFSKQYFFHTWNETDHTVNGEDWSLPPWVKAAPYSGIPPLSKRRRRVDHENGWLCKSLRSDPTFH